MEEAVINLHMHTLYSDGHVTHAEIARAALQTGLDAVIVTDHNVYVEGPEDYYSEGERRLLLLVGEEIHDQARLPQKNHLLVFGAGRELAPLAYDTRRLLEAVRQSGGVAYLAHPVDPAAPAVDEEDFSWEDWQVQGYTGLELWNAMSEFKSLLKTRLHGLYYAFNPQRIAHGPFPQALQRWDELLAAGQRVAVVGGSDAHGFIHSLGPIRRVLFPYEFHFQAVNTHLLLDKPLCGELEEDRAALLRALRLGRAFIGYDLPASTRGFRYTAHGYDQTATMGEEISAQRGVTLQVRLPAKAECRLVRHGQVVQRWDNQQHCSYITSQPGAYRVEVYLQFQGARRGWIFSNPIYVKSK
ncbi:MAG: CehA/McbA family metallohydrolase [Chloroflexota bacterium]